MAEEQPDTHALRAAINAMRRLRTNKTPDPAAFETAQAIPLLVLAVELHHHDAIGVLLTYRTTLPPQLRDPPQREDRGECGIAGTPLITTCAMGFLDTLRLLSQGMPCADLYEVDNNGFTPFLAAAAGRHGPPAERLTFSVVYSSAALTSAMFYDEDEEDDEDLDEFRPRLNGYGNTLALAMEYPDIDPTVLALLVEAGVDIYQSRAETVDRIDKTNNHTDNYTALVRKDRGLSPVAISPSTEYTATINAPYRHHHTPLHMATDFDRIPMLLALIELGADLDVPRHDGRGLVLALFSSVPRLSPIPYNDVTAWAVAVDESTDMTTVLTTLLQRYRPLGHDADVDARNAAARDAIVNEADANGNTPLHFAMAYRLPR
ncbi:hypothetical protein Sste5346_001731 [Sporothrix stenoceras]|uniref:Ankyrin repeat protein n=1 Tax=Sporothrix stenoceras TaxID=5173 RepID=A0ABR3ZKU6_9PEZI